MFPQNIDRSKSDSRTPPPQTDEIPPRRILIAEDDAPVRYLLERLLEMQGWSVVSVADGLAAIDAWDSQPGFDLAILDVRMPHLNGYDTYRRLREKKPAARFLFVSGYADEELEDKIMAEGMCFIPKPFDPDVFLGKVSEILMDRGSTLLAREASSP